MARKVLEESGYTLPELGTLVRDVFNLPRFKRVYAEDATAGRPYLSASEVLFFRPPMTRFLSKAMSPPNADRHFARAGWIILTCSGTVGRVIYATKTLEPFFLTHDLIRIVPRPDLPAGYLFAFLSSWVGQALLAKDQYGAAVPHIEPGHVKPIPVPLLDERLQKAIHEKVEEAARLRNEANELLDRAEALFHQELGLLRFDPREVSYYGEGKVKAFSVSAKDLRLRLDASYHIPLAAAAVDKLKATGCPLATVGDLAERIFIPPRFKRIYVEKEYGVPFLQGIHIVQIKPYDIKYLSSSAHKDLDKWIIRQGWVLVTCSGTVGRIALTPPHWHGWAATQHILRIVPDLSKSHPGYIAVFLATPYGSYQVTRQVYGAVVDELTEDQMKEVVIPDPPLDLQTKIGRLATGAYEMREQANKLEEDAVTLLESSLGD